MGPRHGNSWRQGQGQGKGQGKGQGASKQQLS